jgi:two-component system, NtrC family, sensor histidine kinase HydH
VPCDPEQIKQFLLNLVLNAIQATAGKGTVTIRTVATEESVCIDIYDEGQGITPEDRERIFDPFFTTKENGTGLGLAIALNIATQHGGVLECRPNPGGGTVFRLELPATRQLPQARLKAQML